MKFDLSTLPPGGITNVSLTLHSVNYQASTGLGTLSLNLFGDTDDMWNEGLAELVWAGPLTGSGVPLNVAPVPAATVGNNLVFSTTPAFISYLESNRAINGGNDRATIYIEPFACGTLSILELASKDNTQADPVPTLSVTTASILYVETGGDNARACTDSANPCATIAGAYGKANSGDIIEVLSEGTVETSAITCTREITLRGSGSGTMPTISAAFGGIGFFNINAGCDMTVKGLTIDEGTAFLMFNQSGGLLVAYANNFVWDNDFGAFPGHTSTGGIALLRGNWLGAAFPTDQFSNTTPEVNDYRLGAPVQEWADGVGECGFTIG
ncbi:MAG: hypothetical protein IPH82_29490 [Chloroflexi bacterium]|nr:hypothetical protein [Chloroflexota bacterium]